MTRALERAKVVRFLGTRRCPSELNSKTVRLGKVKAARFHSCADGFAVVEPRPGVLILDPCEEIEGSASP
jgi:hypothetical protein